MMTQVICWFQQARKLRNSFLMATLAAYWMVIFTGTHVPRLPQGMPRVSDKWLHAMAFFGLAFLLIWILKRLIGDPQKAAFWTLACCFVYGMFDETTQMLVRNRNADVSDFLADCLGALAGLLTFFAIRRITDSFSSPSASEKQPLADRRAA